MINVDRLIIPSCTVKIHRSFHANPSQRLRQIAGIADASRYANCWCFTGMHGLPYSRKRLNSTSCVAAEAIREKSQLNTVAIGELLRRRHVGNEVPKRNTWE